MSSPRTTGEGIPFEESGDFERLLGLRDQLERVLQNIDDTMPDFEPTCKHDDAPERQAVFRRSYGYEFFYGKHIGRQEA